MKVRSSLKNLKTRDRNNKLIKRKGRLYVINKKNPRMKARQGQLTFGCILRKSNSNNCRSRI